METLMVIVATAAVVDVVALAVLVRGAAITQIQNVTATTE